MPASHQRAPLCGDALGPDWNDSGTLKRLRHQPPVPQCSQPSQGLLAGTSPHRPVEQQGVPMAGSVLLTAGLPTVLRIPIPGTDGLAVALSPQHWKGRSTSVLFFQDVQGKRTLRLDYGPNKSTGRIDYHWNTHKTFGRFGIADHTVATPAEARAYAGLKAFKHLGRVLLVAGVAIDVASIVVADRPLRRSTEVAGAWAGASAGCRLVGAGGAWAGSWGGPWGMAIGAGAGCILGGWAGYEAGSQAGAVVYDWAAGTVFTPLDSTDPP